MSFYSDKTKAVNLTGVDSSVIVDEMQETIDMWINTNIKWDGFNDTKTVTEFYNVDKLLQSEIVLKHFPIISVTEIVDNAQSDTPKTLSADSYTYDSESGIVQLKNYVNEYDDGTYSIHYFTKGKSAIKITYKYGYNNVPDVIVKLATLLLAKWAKIKSVKIDTGDDNLKSVKIGNYTENYDLGFMSIKSEFDSIIEPMIKRVQEYYADGV